MRDPAAWWLLAACCAAQQPAVSELRPALQQLVVRLQHGVQEQVVLELEDEQEQLVAVEFAADGSRILVATSRRLLVRDLDARTDRVWRPDPQPGIRYAELAADGRVAVATSGQALVLDAALEGVELELRPDQWVVPVTAALLPDGSALVATMTANHVPGHGQVCILDAATQQSRAIYVPDRWGIRAAVLSPRGDLLAVQSGSGPVRLHGLPDGELAEDLDYFYAEPDDKGVRGGWSPSALAFSRDGALLHIGCTRGFVRTWDIDSARERARWRVGSLGPDGRHATIEHLACGPGAGALLSTDATGRVRLWDVDDPDAPRAVAFAAPDGGRLVFCRDGRRFAVVGERRVVVCK